MKIALIGYGKMGKEIERIALDRGHEIVSIIDINNREDMNGEAFASADVAIEFTAPSVAYDNCVQAMQAGVKVVSGSTGWIHQHEEEMRSLCENEGKTLFWSSNFSLGVAIFSAVNKYLAKIMNRFESYSVEMEETHHIHKLDAPSGTAITLGEGIIANLDRKSSWVLGDVTNPDGSITKGVDTNKNELRINAIRRDEVPGIHTVRYESVADSIVITHDAKNRSGFALGAVLAAEYVSEHSGFLGMKDLFDF
ncbi:MAG: 4-hydroxy-tetrahydrodipicolinate reductase [Bacteroidaceae bacterium]|nr:4-hydroxy-tetrahydrodipicolinate reductase [Bacteroidaceae bacterium]